MGWSPLHTLAMETNKVDPINDEIYKKGCIVNEKTELTGMGALHKACQYGRLGNVEKLILEGANVNDKNHWNSTCLHWCVKGAAHMQKQTGFNAADYESIAKLLLEKSRKLLDQKDAEFRTPSELARELQVSNLEALLGKYEEKVRLSKAAAEEKKIANKPKVRRLD